MLPQGRSRPILACHKPTPLSLASSTCIGATSPGPWLQPVSPVPVTCPGAPGPALFTCASLTAGVSQASLQHPAEVAAPGPRCCVTGQRSPPCRREAGERLERAHAALCFPSHSELSAAVWKALEAGAHCQEALPGSAPLGQFPSPPPHRHIMAWCGGVSGPKQAPQPLPEGLEWVGWPGRC